MSKKPSIFDQLGSEERLVAAGKKLEVSVDAALKSFTGPRELSDSFYAELEKLKEFVTGHASAEFFLQAFTLWANSGPTRGKPRSHNRQFSVKLGEIRNGVLQFIEERGYATLASTDIDQTWIAEFITWLKTAPRRERKGKVAALGDGPRAPDTARKQYKALEHLVDAIRASERHSVMLGHELEFPEVKWGDGDGPANPTEELSDADWNAIYTAAARDALATIKQCNADWDAWSRASSDSAQSNEAKAQEDDSFGKLINTIAIKFPGVVPKLSNFREEATASLSSAVKGKKELLRATFCLQPTSETIFPFVVLFAFYSEANTSPLRRLNLLDIQHATVAGAKRIRLFFDKTRAYPYPRSYAVDENDPLSPSSLLEFLKKWSSRIRANAGELENLVFIFVNWWGALSRFNTSAGPTKSSTDEDGVVRTVIGTESCSLWNNALKNFCKKHGLPHFTVKEVRITGLELIREQSGDDSMATVAASGTTSDSVHRRNYEGRRTKLRRAAAIGNAQNGLARFLSSDGRIDHRGDGDAIDPLSATPGWGCVDPYDSPLPTQERGKLCEGFCECPACPLGMVQLTPHGFARTVQIRKAVEDSFHYLSFERWSTAFQPQIEAIDKTWLRLFAAHPDIVEAAKLMNLEDLGILS